MCSSVIVCLPCEGKNTSRPGSIAFVSHNPFFSGLVHLKQIINLDIIMMVAMDRKWRSTITQNHGFFPFSKCWKYCNYSMVTRAWLTSSGFLLQSKNTHTPCSSMQCIQDIYILLFNVILCSRYHIILFGVSVQDFISCSSLQHLFNHRTFSPWCNTICLNMLYWYPNK